MASIAPSRNPPKSILKKGAPSSSSSAKPRPKSTGSSAPSAASRGRPQASAATTTVSINEPPPRSSPAQQRSPSEIRRIALLHASTIQVHKSLEASILNSILYLLDLPPPAPLVFKHHLRFFTPADYDSLIEERNIENLCGYGLCPNPPKRVKSTGKVVAVDGGRRWVDKKQLERFCTDECARRALWVRVQLPEEPSWVRPEIVEHVRVDEQGVVSGIELETEQPADGWDGGDIMLWEERKEGSGLNTEEERRKVVEELRKIGIKGLEMERAGEKGKRNVAGNVGGGDGILVDVKERVVEKGEKVRVPGDEEDEGDGDDDLDELDLVERQVRALRIEGYAPKTGRRDDA